jgi:tetratricopeptide (TPR) repeat protein
MNKDRRLESNEKEKFAAELNALVEKSDRLMDQDIDSAKETALEIVKRAKERRVFEYINKGYNLLAKISSVMNKEDDFLFYTGKVLAKARRANDDRLMVSTMGMRNSYFYNHNQYRRAIRCSKYILDKLKKVYDPQNEMQALLLLGIAYARLEDFNNAYKNLSLSLRKAKKNDDSLMLAKIYYWYGYVLHLDFRYDKATKMYLISIEYNDKHRNELLLGMTKNSLGLIYWKLNKFDRALKYFKDSLHHAEKAANETLLADVYNNIGLIYKEKRDTENTLKYYSLSLQYREGTGNKEKEAITFQNIGNVYKDKGEYDKAIEYYLKTLDIRKELKDHYYLIHTILSILHVKNAVGDVEGAQESVLELKNLLKKVHNKEVVREAYRELSQFFELKGDFRKALEYYKLYKKADEHTQENDMQERIAKLEFKEKSERLKERSLNRMRMDRVKAALATVVTVNHEINQPLMTIQGNLELFRKKYGELSKNRDLDQYLDNIQTALEKITKTIRTLSNGKDFSYQSYIGKTPMLVAGNDKEKKGKE